MKITDEMVEAAIDKWFTASPNWREDGKLVLASIWRDDMRAALTAALATQPDRYAQGFEKAREMAIEAAMDCGSDIVASEIRSMEMPDE